MKRTLQRLLLALAIPFLGAPGALVGQERPRVAVVSFENKTTWWPDVLGSAVADQLATRLVRSGDYRVVERDMLERVMAEQQIQLSGAINPDHVRRIGQVAGVDYLIMGSVVGFDISDRRVGIPGRRYMETQFGSRLTVRVVSTETADVVAAAEGEGTNSKRSADIGISIENTSELNEGALRDAIGPALDKVIESFKAQSYAFGIVPAPEVVGQDNDGGIFISQGENFGITVGTRYEVHRVVQEIKDGDGQLLDTITEVVGHAEVVRVLARSSVLRVEGGPWKKEYRLVPLRPEAGQL